MIKEFGVRWILAVKPYESVLLHGNAGGQNHHHPDEVKEVFNKIAWSDIEKYDTSFMDYLLSFITCVDD